MSKLTQYFSDETRVFIDENYNTHNLSLMKRTSYEAEATKLGEFRLDKGKLVLVLEKNTDLSIVNEISELKEITRTAKAVDDIPF